MLVMIVLAGLFSVLGTVFYSGKGLALLAGYTNLPRQEQDRYDKQALGKFAGRMMFALSFSMLFWVFGSAIQVSWLVTVGLVMFVAIVLFSIIYANTGNRFMKSGR